MKPRLYLETTIPNVDIMFARMKEDLKRLEAEGWQIVSPGPREPVETSTALREEPPKKGE